MDNYPDAYIVCPNCGEPTHCILPCRMSDCYFSGCSECMVWDGEKAIDYFCTNKCIEKFNSDLTSPSSNPGDPS